MESGLVLKRYSTWMSRWKLVNGDRISGLFHPNSSPSYKDRL